MKYINVFRAFFRDTESAVRVNREPVRWFDVKSGKSASNRLPVTSFAEVCNSSPVGLFAANDCSANESIETGSQKTQFR
jgi:hypothetical protein